MNNRFVWCTVIVLCCMSVIAEVSDINVRCVFPEIAIPKAGPYDLRCEYQKEALGAVKPRFFWKYAGVKPKTFKLNISTSRECLSRGDVFSGEFSSHLYVEPELYLKPFTRYWWQVEGDGNISSSSFVTGIENWRMPFFRPEKPCAEHDYWIARRRIVLSSPKSVIVAIVSSGYHKFYVNGKSASETFGPNRSHIEDGYLLATTYDVTDLVKDGENEFAIIASEGWLRESLGSDGKKRKASAPACISSSLSIDGCAVTADGIIPVDSSTPWNVAKSGDRAIGGWKFGDHGGEHLRDMPADYEREEYPGVLVDGSGLAIVRIFGGTDPSKEFD